MTQSYHCQNCHINWPHISLYRECPKCRKSNIVRNLQDLNILNENEAKSLSRLYNFEYYLETEHEESDDLDPKLEERLDRHIQEVKQAYREQKHQNKDSRKPDAFDKIIANQFDEEAQSRILEIEKILRGKSFEN